MGAYRGQSRVSTRTNRSVRGGDQSEEFSARRRAGIRMALVRCVGCRSLWGGQTIAGAKNSARVGAPSARVTETLKCRSGGVATRDAGSLTEPRDATHRVTACNRRPTLVAAPSTDHQRAAAHAIRPVAASSVPKPRVLCGEKYRI